MSFCPDTDRQRLAGSTAASKRVSSAKGMMAGRLAWQTGIEIAQRPAQRGRCVSQTTVSRQSTISSSCSLHAIHFFADSSYSSRRHAEGRDVNLRLYLSARIPSWFGGSLELSRESLPLIPGESLATLAVQNASTQRQLQLSTATAQLQLAGELCLRPSLDSMDNRVPLCSSAHCEAIGDGCTGG